MSGGAGAGGVSGAAGAAGAGPAGAAGAGPAGAAGAGPAEQALAALGLDPALAGGLAVDAPGPWLGSPLAVDTLAQATVGAALVAAADLVQARGAARPAVSVDGRHVALAFGSERHARVDGRELGAPFDPTSSFMPAADGWVRLHGNYPHHRAALRRALGLGEDADAAAVRAAVARRTALEVEDAVVAAGGCAAAVRTEVEWAAHPQGAAVVAQPLLAFAPGPGGAASPLPPLAGDDALPAAGVRVLDLTRVISGPVGTRMLAALGAEVLRIDDPALPEIPLQAIDTGPGKRSGLLDLRAPADRAAFEALLAQADVLVQGYRPGALAAYGLDAAALAQRHPQLTTVTLSAWGDGGPWAGRRGFDSLVQAASGIAVACAAADGEARRDAALGGAAADGGAKPGALPVQALDHGTGYLIAAAALRGLALRQREGRAAHARLALARTARWLLELPRPAGGAAAVAAQPAAASAASATLEPAPFLTRLRSPLGAVTLVAPPGRLGGRPLGWTRGPVPLGADAARWEPSG